MNFSSKDWIAGLMPGKDWRRDMIERGQNPFASSSDKGLQPRSEQVNRYEDVRRQLGLDENNDRGLGGRQLTDRFAGERLFESMDDNQI